MQPDLTGDGGRVMRRCDSFCPRKINLLRERLRDFFAILDIFDDEWGGGVYGIKSRDRIRKARG